jgi:hypothetical protein
MKATHHDQITELQNKLKEKDNEIEQMQAKTTVLERELGKEFSLNMQQTPECTDYIDKKKLEEKGSEMVRMENKTSVLVKEQEENHFEKKLKERCLDAVTKLNAVKRSLICFCLVTLGNVLFFFLRGT